MICMGHLQYGLLLWELAVDGMVVDIAWKEPGGVGVNEHGFSLNRDEKKPQSISGMRLGG
jgi:hypothetical protein